MSNAIKEAVNWEAIIERGYTLQEEYIVIHNDELIRVRMDDESFWGILIPGYPNRFVFANNPVAFWGGPRSIVGMVGHLDDRIVDINKSIELFKKAGKAAIDYYNHKEQDAQKTTN